MSDTVMLVGCGNMGRAMLKGWMKAAPDLTALVVEPDADLREAAAALGAQVFAKISAVPSGAAPALIFLAVKPQVMGDVLPDYKSYDATFVSVAAGVTVESLRDGLGEDARVIRCMPNTPAAIGPWHDGLLCDRYRIGQCSQPDRPIARHFGRCCVD